MTPGTSLSVFALSPSNEFAATVAAMLDGVDGVRFRSRLGGLDGTQEELAQATERADVLLIDLKADDEGELRQLGRIIEQAKGRRAVIATAPNLSSHGIRGLIRQGVDDFVSQPIERGELIEALEGARTSLREARRNGRAGKVIAVTRAKGGMGASTLATHIALALAEKTGRKEPEKQVALLDLDVQFGDLALMLDLEAGGAMVEIMKDPSRLDANLLRTSMTRHKSGLQVLPAPAELVPLDALSAASAGRLVDLAREEFDYVILDLPLAAPGWLESILQRTDQLVLVSQLNVAAVRQTRRLMDVIKDEGLYEVQVSVVMNRYVRRWGERGRLNQAIKALGQPFAHYVPDDPGLALESLNRGTPLFELKARARLCRSLRELASGCVTLLQQRDAAGATAQTA